jgi:cell division protein FtsL
MASKRVGGRGRIRFALVMLAFLVISGGVILRRTFGIAGEHELLLLSGRRAALVAERLRLESEIRTASSRAHLQPIAEQQLQMRVPDASQVITVPRGGGVP